MENRRERRRFKRANFPCKIHILTAPVHTIRCRTENIGAGGVRVIIDEKLDFFSTVGLELYLSPLPIVCKGRIVWVVEKRTGRQMVKFDTGLEFHQISQKDRRTIDIFIKSLI